MTGCEERGRRRLGKGKGGHLINYKLGVDFHNSTARSISPGQTGRKKRGKNRILSSSAWCVLRQRFMDSRFTEADGQDAVDQHARAGEKKRGRGEGEKKGKKKKWVSVPLSRRSNSTLNRNGRHARYERKKGKRGKAKRKGRSHFLSSSLCHDTQISAISDQSGNDRRQAYEKGEGGGGGGEKGKKGGKERYRLPVSTPPLLSPGFCRFG